MLPPFIVTLSTLTDHATVVVAGAGGGIGAEFVRQLRAAANVERVIALYRRPPEKAPPDVEVLPFDLGDEDSIRRASQVAAFHGPVDAVIVATGLLHTDGMQPEKTFAAISPDAMLEAFRVNALGPALVAKHFLPLLRRDAKTVFAALSARVGSIGDNRLGGWASYRASKAALNMLLRTAAIEQRRTRPGSVVVALHPGTVDTPLSAPFQRGVPPQKLFTAEFAARSLLGVIDRLGPDDSGGFFAWDGQAVDF